MGTIPASAIVNVLPSVLNAGGNALILNGVMLTQNHRVPIGQVLSFPTAVAVGSFFGTASMEYSLSVIYFLGYDSSTQKPGSLLVATYNSAAASAYMRTGLVSSLSIASLAALTGSLTVVMDGYTWTDGSLSLSGATSYSAAAALIQAGITASPPTECSFNGSIAPETISITASIAGYVLTVNSVVSGTVVPGTILTGTGVTTGTMVTSQLTGIINGVGTYAVSIAQVVLNEAMAGSYGLLTAAAPSSGTLSVGQTVVGAGVTLGTQITGLDSGLGLAGTYYVTPSETEVTVEAMTTTGTPPTVIFDSISGAFMFMSGIVGSSSSAAYATGTLATALFATQATGATLSQGAYAAQPGAFMNGLTAVTQNWATFWTVFDPDGGSGNQQKQLFSAWTNGTQNRYCYVAWDTDVTPTESEQASSSLGAILEATESSGTACIYDPTNGPEIAAFVCGAGASIDQQATNGRITLAFKHQTGLSAGVTNQTVADNLIANGYSFYGVYATANQDFVFLYPGSVSGPFEWLDSYLNEIWLNNALQQALMELLVTVTSIPYNAAGYALIEAACMDPINAALTFGAMRAGVPLSAAQVAEVNNTAGIAIDVTLSQVGWYLQVVPATPQIRAARLSPQCFLWYMDGQAVQQITLNSVDVQ
jgi:Protein of unknown function (DUF3383)